MGLYSIGLSILLSKLMSMPVAPRHFLWQWIPCDNYSLGKYKRLFIFIKANLVLLKVYHKDYFVWLALRKGTLASWRSLGLSGSRSHSFQDITLNSGRKRDEDELWADCLCGTNHNALNSAQPQRFCCAWTEHLLAGVMPFLPSKKSTIDSNLCGSHCWHWGHIMHEQTFPPALPQQCARAKFVSLYKPHE